MGRKEYDSINNRLDKYHRAIALVNVQAELEALWLSTDNIEIAYLQQELRRLHAVLEGEDTKYYHYDDLV